MQIHKPVLYNEVIEKLEIKPNGIYIDATFGRGGHSQGILDKLGPDGKLIAIDRDLEAIEVAKKITDKRFVIEHAPFTEMQRICEKHNVVGKVDGILMDLGVSSPQLDDAARGFSFSSEGPLDMRMDTTTGITAAKWLETATEEEISSVLKEFGEEKLHKKIARTIKNNLPIETTTQLADIVKSAYRYKVKHHPATRTFQAIRIHINEELSFVEKTLQQTLSLLTSKGRLAVISFHSLEDRVVKKFIKKTVSVEQPDTRLPIQNVNLEKDFIEIGKIKPSKEELEENPRARSAILRVMEKV